MEVYAKDYKNKYYMDHFYVGCCGCQKKEQPIQELEEIGSEKSETSKKRRDKKRKRAYMSMSAELLCRQVYMSYNKTAECMRRYKKQEEFAENADISEINQAALLQDEEQIYVPAAGEVDHSLKEEGEAGDAGGSQSEYRHKRRIDDTCRDWRIQSGQVL